jgi:type I restriction enzyme S subunit
MSSNAMLWRTAPLGEWPISFIDGDRSSKYPKRSELVAEGVPFLNSTNISNATLGKHGLDCITVEKAASIRKGKVQEGDIVMTTRGSIGKVAICPSWASGSVINAQMLLLRADGVDLEAKYLFHALRSQPFQDRIKGFASGSAQPQIPMRDLKQIEFSAPDILSQRRIVSILSAYDDLIENNTRRIEILEEMARRLYEEWFVQFRFPGHEGVEFKESELGLIPEGWVVSCLGDIAEEIREAVHPSSVSPDTPYIGLEHLPRRSITLREWGSADSVSSGKLFFRRGDVLFGKIRPYFHKVVIAPFSGICSSDTILIRPKKDNFLGVVLCCSSSDKFVDYATQTSNGTKMPRADWKVLKNYPVLIPSDGILSDFNSFVLGVVGQARNLMLKNVNLRAQRDLLLPKLISGEIDVSDIPMPT